MSEITILQKFCTSDQLREIRASWDNETAEYKTLSDAIARLEG